MVRSWHSEGTTEATLYNVTAVLSLSADLSNSASTRNESNVVDVLQRYLEICPSRVRCDKLGADCIDCEFNSTCRYGANVSAVCHVKPQIICLVCTLCISSLGRDVKVIIYHCHVIQYISLQGIVNGHVPSVLFLVFYLHRAWPGGIGP